MKQIFRWRTSSLFVHTTPIWSHPTHGLSWEFNTPLQAEAPWSAAGTLRNFRIDVEAATVGDIGFTVFKNGVATSLVATVPSMTLSGSDLTNSVTLVPGDYLSLRAVRPSGSDSVNYVRGYIEFEGTDATESCYSTKVGPGSYVNTSIINGGLYNPFNPEQGWAAGGDPGIVPTDGVINRLDIRLTASPGANVWQFAFVKNGVLQDGSSGTPDTRLQMTGTVTGVKTGFSLSVAAADELYIRSTLISGTAGSIRAGVSLRFVPTIEGETIVNVRTQQGYSAGTTKYLGVFGSQIVLSQTESFFSHPEYTTWKFRKFYIRPSGGGFGAGAIGVTFTVRKNGVDTLVGGFNANAGISGLDLTDHVDVVSTDKITIRGVATAGITTRNAQFAYVLFNGVEPPPVGTGDFVALRALLISKGYIGDPIEGVGDFTDSPASIGGTGFTGPPVLVTGEFVDKPSFFRAAGTQYPKRLTLYINGLDYNEWWWTQDPWDVSKDGPQETAHFSVRDPLSGTHAKRVTKGDTFLILHPEGGLICGGEVTEVVETSLIEGIGTVCRCTGEDWMFLLDQIYIFPQRFLPQPILDFWASIYDKYLAPRGWINLNQRTGGPDLPELIVDKTIHLRELFNRVEQKVPWPLRVNGMKEAAMNEPGVLIWPYSGLDGNNAKISSDVQVTEEVVHIPTRYILEGVEPPYGKGPVHHNENRSVTSQYHVVFPVNVLPTKVTGAIAADFAATTNTISLKELPPGMRIRWADEFFIGSDPRRYFVGLGTFTVGGDGKVTIATDTMELDGKEGTEVIFQERTGIDLKVNGILTAFDGGESHWVWDGAEAQFVYTGGSLPIGTSIRYEAWITAPWIMRAWETSNPPPVMYHGGFDYNLIVDEVLENEDMWDPETTVRYMRSKLADPYTSKKILDVTTHWHGLYPYIVVQCNFPKRRVSGTWVLEKVDVRSNGADPASTLNDLVYHATLRKDIYGKSIWGFFQPVSKLKWGSGALISECVAQGSIVVYEDFTRTPTDFGAGGNIFGFKQVFESNPDTGDYWEQPYWDGPGSPYPQEYVYAKILVTEAVFRATDGRGYSGLPAIIGDPGFHGGTDGLSDPWFACAVVFHGLGTIVHAEFAEDYPYFYNYLCAAHQMYMTCYYSFTRAALTNNGYDEYGFFCPLFGVNSSGFYEDNYVAMTNHGSIPSYTLGVTDYDSAMGSGMDTDPVSCPATFKVWKEDVIFVAVAVWGYNVASPGNVTDNIGTVYSLLAQTGTPGAAGIRVYKGIIPIDTGMGEWYATYTPIIAERATIGVQQVSTDNLDVLQIVTKHNSGTSHNAGLGATTDLRATVFGFLASSTPGNSGYTAVGGEPGVGWFEYINVNPTNTHAQLISMHGRVKNAGTVMDTTWTSSVPAESEVIGIEINHPSRNNEEAYLRSQGFDLDVVLAGYIIDPVTGYWDWIDFDEYFGPFPFDDIEEKGPLKCIFCYRCGTFNWDPESDVATLQADGWFKVSINGKLLVHVEGFPLYISDSTWVPETWEDTQNTAIGVFFGWYGFAGELSHVRVTSSGMNPATSYPPRIDPPVPPLITYLPVGTIMIGGYGDSVNFSYLSHNGDTHYPQPPSAPVPGTGLHTLARLSTGDIAQISFTPPSGSEMGIGVYNGNDLSVRSQYTGSRHNYATIAADALGYWYLAKWSTTVCQFTRLNANSAQVASWDIAVPFTLDTFSKGAMAVSEDGLMAYVWLNKAVGHPDYNTKIRIHKFSLAGSGSYLGEFISDWDTHPGYGSLLCVPGSSDLLVCFNRRNYTSGVDSRSYGSLRRYTPSGTLVWTAGSPAGEAAPGDHQWFSVALGLPGDTHFLAWAYGDIPTTSNSRYVWFSYATGAPDNTRNFTPDDGAGFDYDSQMVVLTHALTGYTPIEPPPPPLVIPAGSIMVSGNGVSENCVILSQNGAISYPPPPTAEIPGGTMFSGLCRTSANAIARSGGNTASAPPTSFADIFYANNLGRIGGTVGPQIGYLVAADFLGYFYTFHIGDTGLGPITVKRFGSTGSLVATWVMTYPTDTYQNGGLTPAFGVTPDGLMIYCWLRDRFTGTTFIQRVHKFSLAGAGSYVGLLHPTDFSGQDATPGGSYGGILVVPNGASASTADVLVGFHHLNDGSSYGTTTPGAIRRYTPSGTIVWTSGTPAGAGQLDYGWLAYGMPSEVEPPDFLAIAYDLSLSTSSRVRYCWFNMATGAPDNTRNFVPEAGSFAFNSQAVVLAQSITSG